jgi:hypothetical protein
VSTDQLALRAALARSDHPPLVKLLPSGDADKTTVRKVAVRYALLLAHKHDYLWGGSPSRVRWMRPAPVKLPWAECWRTTQSASLQLGIEYGRAAVPIARRRRAG